MTKNNILERTIEQGLFASRWLMAPFYIGLSMALGGLLMSFVKELWHFFQTIDSFNQNEVVLGACSQTGIKKEYFLSFFNFKRFE